MRILNMRAIYLRFLTISIFFFRTSRPGRAQKGGTTPEPDHQRSQGSRDLQSGRSEERSTIFLKNPWSTPNPQVAQCPGAAEDLLPQAGGPRAGAPSHRKNVCLQHPFLKSLASVGRSVAIPGFAIRSLHFTFWGYNRKITIKRVWSEHKSNRTWQQAAIFSLAKYKSF